MFGQREFGRYFVNGFRFRTTLLIRFPVARTAPVDVPPGSFSPLVLPGPVATSVFSFISAWNGFLFAKSFTVGDPSQPTLPTALPVFSLVLVQRRPVSGPGGAVKD
jgi:hypothetical protein